MRYEIVIGHIGDNSMDFSEEIEADCAVTAVLRVGMSLDAINPENWEVKGWNPVGAD